MPSSTTYTNARANFAELCNHVAETREPVVIHRRAAEDVALISAAELDSLTETAHLVRSPENARRLLTALARAKRREAKPSSVEELKRDVGLQ